MPTNRYKNEEEHTKHKEQCRKLMKRNYYEQNGKAKSGIKYYKRKYADDEYALSIIANQDITIQEKLKQLKTYNFTKKMMECEN